jgi:hypothetical protein
MFGWSQVCFADAEASARLMTCVTAASLLYRAYSLADPGTACSAAWNPTFGWVPSQKGLVHRSQRQRGKIHGVRVALASVPKP